MNRTEELSRFEPVVTGMISPPGEDEIIRRDSGTDTRFKPGVSGNPSGRPKRTKEEKDALEAIKAMAPEAADKLRTLLNSSRTSAAMKVKICEIILDRTYGKSESAVKLTSVQQTVEQSRDYILSLVERVREADEE